VSLTRSFGFVQNYVSHVNLMNLIILGQEDMQFRAINFFAKL